MRMAAARPLAQDLCMAVAAIVQSSGIGMRIHPRVLLVILVGEGLQQDRDRSREIRFTADEISLLPCRDARGCRMKPGQAKASRVIRDHGVVRLALEADRGTGYGSIGIAHLARHDYHGASSFVNANGTAMKEPGPCTNEDAQEDDA